MMLRYGAWMLTNSRINPGLTNKNLLSREWPGRFFCAIRRAAGCVIPVVVWDHCPERINGRDIVQRGGELCAESEIALVTQSVSPAVKRPPRKSKAISQPNSMQSDLVITWLRNGRLIVQRECRRIYFGGRLLSPYAREQRSTSPGIKPGACFCYVYFGNRSRAGA